MWSVENYAHSWQAKRRREVCVERVHFLHIHDLGPKDANYTKISGFITNTTLMGGLHTEDTTNVRPVRATRSEQCEAGRLEFYHQLRRTDSSFTFLQRLLNVLQTLPDDGWGWEALESPCLQRGCYVVRPNGGGDVAHGKDHARLYVLRYIFRRGMHTSQMASAQISEDRKIIRVSLRRRDGVEDAHELLSGFLDGRFGDFLDQQRVVVVEDLGCPTGPAEVKVVRAGDGYDFEACRRCQLGRHRADRR